jgi:hypothetical protein
MVAPELCDILIDFYKNDSYYPQTIEICKLGE